VEEWVRASLVEDRPRIGGEVDGERADVGASGFTQRWLCSTISVPTPGLRAHVLNSPRPASGYGQPHE
jgi:hypothetical protein